MGLAHPVEVDLDGEVRVRSHLLHEAVEEDGVRAELHVLAAVEAALDELCVGLVDEGLAAADRDDGGAALVHRTEALLEAHLLVIRVLVLHDAAAAGAGQVARVEGLEHEHQRVVLPSREPLLRDVAE